MFDNPESCFEALTDTRRENKNKIHKLSDIVFLVLAAVISGIEDEVGPISGGGRNKTGVTPRTTTSKPEIRLEENIPQSHAYCQAAVA
jgi:hypothetical protein